jgi:hypothetical protein
MSIPKIVGRTIGITIRNVLNIILLYFVWNNVHWSVATILTLLTIEHEIESIVRTVKL